MDDFITTRRTAALSERVAFKLEDTPRMGVHNPLFNLREITKNLILLEDHLAHPYKICPDCIRKHLLCVEGLAEEGTCLDSAGKYTEGMEKLAEMARNWLEAFTDGVAPLEIAGWIRNIRKAILPMSFDPRGMKERVASRHLYLKIVCPHR